MSTILVTGATGFIGSHTCVELIQSGYHVVGTDNFCNSKPAVLDRIQTTTEKKMDFIKADLCHPEELDQIFQQYQIDAVIHFAGLKAVGESVEKPLEYY